MSGTQKMFDVVQKHFVSSTNVSQFAQPKKHHGQQCVRNNVFSFTRALNKVFESRHSQSSVKLQASRFKIQDSRFKIQDSRFKIQDSRFKIQDSRFKIQDSAYLPFYLVYCYVSIFQ